MILYVINNTISYHIKGSALPPRGSTSPSPPNARRPSEASGRRPRRAPPGRRLAARSRLCIAPSESDTGFAGGESRQLAEGGSRSSRSPSQRLISSLVEAQERLRKAGQFGSSILLKLKHGKQVTWLNSRSSSTQQADVHDCRTDMTEYSPRNSHSADTGIRVAHNT